MKNAMVLVHILILTFIFSFSTGFLTSTETTDSQAQAFEAQPLENAQFLEVYINEQNVGIVKFASHGLNLFDQALIEKHTYFDREVFVSGDIHFKKANEGITEASADTMIIEAMKDAFSVETTAYTIIIGEEVIAYLPYEENAREVFELVKKPYRELVESKPNTVLEEISITEEPTIGTAIVPYDNMVDVETALKLITVGVEKAQDYEVQEGDTLWDISFKFDIDVADLMLANPDLKGEMIHPGDMLRIMDVRNKTTVFTRERHVYSETVGYDTEIRQTDELFVGQSRTVQRGVDGENEVTIYITRENGRETDRGILSDEVLKEPVIRIIERGTRARPRRVETASRGNDRPSDLNPIPREGVEMMPWFDGVNNIFHRGMVVKVTHINTGLTFYARRYGGRFHADSEPLTTEDTEILRRIYGGGFSWNREAVLVEVGGRRIAASMNGMPHGGEYIQDNNFQGHFCIHFYGSFLHETGRRDGRHQEMVRYAAGR